MVVFTTVDPAGTEAGYCLSRYFDELDERFDDGFQVDLSIQADASELIPPSGAFLVGKLGDKSVACGALSRLQPGICYLKRMWVDGSVRGRGLGRRLLAALEDRAYELGYHTVRLETNQTLIEAIQLYRTSGYVEVEPFNDEHYADHWFEKRIG